MSLISISLQVHDEFEAQGVPKPCANLAQMDDLLDKFTGLRNLLQARQGSIERLADEHSDGVGELIIDYQNISAKVDARIDRVSDVLSRLKEFNNLYESYLGWLADAEPRINRLPVDRDPAVTYASRVAELKV